MSEQQCATEGCERPARWIPIVEGNRLGSNAPRRCTECCNAISQALDALAGVGPEYLHAVRTLYEGATT